ncbi:TPA: hypothetical protein BOS_2864 [Bos taurus]|nr:TPA: hypothetical protein BOS_2864 [Bos taurus]
MCGADTPCCEDVGEAAGESCDLSCDGGYLVGYHRDSAHLDPQGTQCPAQKVLGTFHLDGGNRPLARLPVSCHSTLP